jgi:hypothetical protein
MRQYYLLLICLLVLQSARVQAVEFSTSALKPSLLDPNGAIGAFFPSGDSRIAYYFVADLQKGELLTQLSFKGHAGREKRVELALLDSEARLVSSYWIQGVETQKDAIRSFPIEVAGQRILRVTVFGPETDEFRVELGGRALPPPPTSIKAPPPPQPLPSSPQPVAKAPPPAKKPLVAKKK